MKQNRLRIISMLLALCLCFGCGVFPSLTASAESYAAGGARTRMGDLDRDGAVSSADARIALRVSVHLDSLDEALTKAADVDRDGSVTSSDARTILRVSVHLDTLTEEPDCSGLRLGLICVHDENAEYDLNFINAFKSACAGLGIPAENCLIRYNVPESPDCYDTAVSLAKAGCDVIFGDSFGYEDFLIEAAKRYPGVQFCHATGTKAHTAGLANYHNAYNAEYQGRFLTGIAAGMKLNEMIAAGKLAADQARLGFVGAFSYAQVVSAYTAFFLGARSVCPSAAMDVTFVGAWYDEAAECDAAEKLINGGCAVISQYSDSLGAPTACERKGVPNVPYSGSTAVACPNTCLVGYSVNWAPYFTYAAKAVAAGEPIAVNWTGTLATGSVVLSDVNDTAAAPGTRQKLAETAELLNRGAMRVFDTAAFTVNGNPLTSYLANVDEDAMYEGDTEAIADGYFHESEYRSAPYFDVFIDGITLLNMAF